MPLPVPSPLRMLSAQIEINSGYICEAVTSLRFQLSTQVLAKSVILCQRRDPILNALKVH